MTGEERPRPQYRGVLEVVDRYIDVDQLRFSKADLLPRMRWWEWTWYVVMNVAFIVAFNWLDAWFGERLSGVPVLNYVPWVVSWPVLGLVWMVAAYLLLPAREARKQAKAEAVLLTGLWLVLVVVQWVVPWQFM